MDKSQQRSSKHIDAASRSMLYVSLTPGNDNTIAISFIVITNIIIY